MKFHSTPPPLSPTIHELPLVVYYIFEVDVLDAPIGVLLGLGQGIGQAIPVLEFNYLQTTVVFFLRCVWGHCLAEKSSPPPPFPMFQSFLPAHPLIFHNIGLHSSFHEPLQASPLYSTPYNEGIPPSMFNSWCCSLVRY